MPAFGGFSPYPRRFGGGRPRSQIILDSLNADRGDSLNASDRDTKVYIENLAIARAIAAAWGTNQRLSQMWDGARMSDTTLARWEKLLALYPLPTDDEPTRRARVTAVFERFGQGAVSGNLHSVLIAALGDAFVNVEYISYANAYIQVPDGTYPWGVVGSSPWSSTVAHVLVRLQKPANWTEGEFYEAAALVVPLLEPMLPVYATVDWYRGGTISVNVSGGPSAGGFYLDDTNNLDNQVFDV